MLPLLLAGLGLAAGAGKSVLDQAAEKKQRQLQAETTRYSPWTGMQAEAPKRTDWLGNMLQGGLGGGMMGMNIDKVMGPSTTSGMGPVADGDSYGAFLQEQNGGAQGVGPVANGNLYSAMLQKSPWYR